MKTIICFLAISVISALVTGCVSTSTGGLEVSLKEDSEKSTIRIDDSFFKQHIDVEDVLVRRAATGFLEARVRVRNKLGKDFSLQYKYEWFDSDGMEVQPGSRPWQQIVAHGGEAVTLSATAPEKSASSFITRLRRVR